MGCKFDSSVVLLSGGRNLKPHICTKKVCEYPHPAVLTSVRSRCYLSSTQHQHFMWRYKPLCTNHTLLCPVVSAYLGLQQSGVEEKCFFLQLVFPVIKNKSEYLLNWLNAILTALDNTRTF